MKNNEICKNAGFISEDELLDLVDANDINGGTTIPCSVVATAVGISGLFTVTSACTTKCPR